MSKNGRRAHSIDEIVDKGPAGRTKVYSEIKAGRLEARKCGRRTFILDEDYQAWLQSLPAMNSEAA